MPRGVTTTTAKAISAEKTGAGRHR